MSRYIDADRIDIRAREGYNHDGVLYIPYRDVRKSLDSAPSIDIVRCGECRYKRLYDDGETKYYYCALEDRPNRQWSVDDTDFCSWGEREGE